MVEEVVAVADPAPWMVGGGRAASPWGGEVATIERTIPRVTDAGKFGNDRSNSDALLLEASYEYSP